MGGRRIAMVVVSFSSSLHVRMVNWSLRVLAPLEIPRREGKKRETFCVSFCQHHTRRKEPSKSKQRR